MVSPTLPQDLTQSLGENEENQFGVKVYPNMQHGFAARPRHEDVTQCMAAFEDAVEFFNRHQMK
jgi:dienelactone hydrolase